MNSLYILLTIIVILMIIAIILQHKINKSRKLLIDKLVDNNIEKIKELVSNDIEQKINKENGENEQNI